MLSCFSKTQETDNPIGLVLLKQHYNLHERICCHKWNANFMMCFVNQAPALCLLITVVVILKEECFQQVETNAIIHLNTHEG